MSEEEAYRDVWMSDDQWSCALLLRDLFHGFHHIDGDIRPCSTGIQINTSGRLFATYDFDGLTRAVIMAHDRCIRFEIRPCTPQLLKLTLWQRKGRDGAMHDRHPTMEDAIAAARGQS